MCDTDGISDFFGFSGGADASAAGASSASGQTAPAVSDTAAATPAADNSLSIPTSFFSSLTGGGSAASTGAGAAPVASAASAPALSGAPLDLSTLTAGGSTPVAGQSAVGADTGAGNTNSILSTANPQPAATTPSTTQSIMQSLGLGNASTGDVLKGLAGAGGLAYNAVKSSASTPAEKAVQGMAQNANAQGTQLEQYLSNGTLPPGAQQYVNQQVAAQQASIMSKYAQLGMSGSTAEAQELANVQSQAQAQMFQIATQLYQQGVSQTGASSQLYNTLMTAQSADNTNMSNAISNFVSSLAGGTTPTTNKSSLVSL